LAVSSCGSDADDEARELAGRSAASEVTPPSKTLVSAKDIAATKEDAPERTLLRFWSDAQWRAWSQAVGWYEASMRDYIGTGQIVEALKSQAAFYRASKPDIFSVTRTDDRAVVRYTTTDSARNLSEHSMVFQRVGRQWQIFFDSYLDTGLRTAAQSAEQLKVAPLARKPSPQAIRTGDAASRIQSGYLQDVDRRSRGRALNPR